MTSDENAWHQLDRDQAAERLQSDLAAGLSADEVVRRRQQYGANELAEADTRGAWRIFWEQCSSAMVVMLVLAAGVSIYLHEYKDAAAILTIVVLNASLGFVQDYRAEKAMAALKQLAVPTVRVRRDGRVQEVSASDLVPGDVVLLEAGNSVPADSRVLLSANLRVQESALTGESEPVNKIDQPISGHDRALGDRQNMLYLGTIVTYGRGEGLVTATGMETELGRIAGMLQSVHRAPTPLQRRLAQLGQRLAAVALVIVAIVLVLGLLRGESPKLMFMTALSMAVAAVPEGLPAVATVALAIGAKRMFRRRALIRKLPAVETLGSVTVICSDKTGTLTENRMTVEVLDIAGNRLQLTEKMRHGQPVWQPDGELRSTVVECPALALLAAGGALCNDAQLEADAEHQGRLHAVGDPTEGALVIAAARMGLKKPELELAFRRVAELPFDSERKRMTTVHRYESIPEALPGELDAVLDAVLRSVEAIVDGGYIAFAKGAVDSVLDVSQQVLINDRAEPLDETWRTRIINAQDELAESGMRVLGVAFRPVAAPPSQSDVASIESDLIFLGMAGMIDPARPEAREAVARCRTAGICPIMITGDHPLTAMHIAKDLGIGDGRVLTGRDLAQMSVAELEPLVSEVSVYARVSPEHKLNIIQALQNRGHIVAMTGDGVNDAPALKTADIGVAMGITGTDVAKEASDAVLLDDNFATVVNAVEEGRIIFDNIRKFIKYTMTSNAGEIWVMLLAPFLGMPLPLLPLQILWVNLATDGLPGLALAVEPAERDTMRRPPYPPAQSVIDRSMAIDIGWIGLLMGIISLGIGFWYWSGAPTDAYDPAWGTKIFTVLTLSQLGNVLALRSRHDSLFTIGLRSNRWMLAAVLLTFGLQLAVIYAPPLQEIFRTVPLTGGELGICLALSTVVFWSVEARKWVLRRRNKSISR